MGPQHSGGRRPLDAELNLVPFIDLLCSLIAFLLMTAVWAQIAALEVAQTKSGEDIVEQKDGLGLRIFVLESGLKIFGKGTEIDMPYDLTALATLLAEKRRAFPDDHEVYIDVADKVSYDKMVSTMDTCNAAGLTSIALGGSAL
ncbi:MAG: biopolymer transporter ExbD [Clostridia bacterium]|nr:biopolymer transporter ExbD [Deltaproteobacteria bacterium]